MKGPVEAVKAVKKPKQALKRKLEVKAPIKDDTGPDVQNKSVLNALRVLKRLSEIAAEKKNALFDDTQPLIMQVDCVKVPKCTARKLRFTLPNSLVTDTSEICLFVADLKKGKRIDHEATVQHYEDEFRAKGITNIKTFIPVRQVRVEFDQMEMKRRLLTQYDFFLADARISGLLAHKLGTTFFRKNRMPTPVKIDEDNVKERIEKALHKTVMKLHGTGNSFALHVANASHSEKQIIENIQAVISQIDKQFPGGWANIRSIYLKNPLSMSLPIYVTLKNKNLVKNITIKPLYNTDKFEEDDLSTMMNKKVKVYMNGKVSLRRTKDDDDDLVDDDDELIDNVEDEEKLDNENGVHLSEDADIISENDESDEPEEPVAKKKKVTKKEQIKNKSKKGKENKVKVEEVVQELQETVKEIKNKSKRGKANTVKEVKDVVQETQETVKEIKNKPKKGKENKVKVENVVQETQETVKEIKNKSKKGKENKVKVEDAVKDIQEIVKEVKNKTKKGKENKVKQVKDVAQEIQETVKEVTVKQVKNKSKKGKENKLKEIEDVQKTPDTAKQVKVKKNKSKKQK